jgi:hypothetical protein
MGLIAAYWSEPQRIILVSRTWRAGIKRLAVVRDAGSSRRMQKRAIHISLYRIERTGFDNFPALSSATLPRLKNWGRRFANASRGVKRTV